MELKKSPLLFHEFSILDSHFETVIHDNVQKCDFNQIPIDVDFEIFEAKDNEYLYNIVLNINGNYNENPVSGYKFSITVNGIFELTDIKEDNKSQIGQFLNYSALPMLISSVRNYILNISSYAPYGKYLLPALDLNALIKDKNQEEPESNKKS